MVGQVVDAKMLNQGFERYAHEPGLPFKIYFVFRSILTKEGHDIGAINNIYKQCLAQARLNIMKVL
jgi:hypothetical protein